MIPSETKNQIQNLVDSQLVEWGLARENYDALSGVLVKSFQIGDNNIRLQYNPKRIISSAAKVDPKSLSERPCFLCQHNRPKEQVGLDYPGGFIILLNPYPVFSPHFTVPSVSHTPQRIPGKFGTMLSLARDMYGHVIIYNGPNCGASAPDHFHFQAFGRYNMPVEEEYSRFITERVQISSDTDFCSVAGYQRHFPAIISGSLEESCLLFEKIYDFLEHSVPSDDEPMMNIIAWYENDKWIILIFPRKLHRPWQYFRTDEKQILLSPASIDMGGVLITPRKEDYNKITHGDIEDIFSQVCADEELIYQLSGRIKNDL